MLKLIQEIPFDRDAWPGAWMWSATAERSLEVVQFTIRFSTDEITTPLRMHISADNQYKLYLDGEYIGSGPQRGDVYSWYFDTYEISGLNAVNEHVLSAIVFCDRYTAPSAQMSVRPALLAVAEGINGELFNSPHQWRCRALENVAPVSVPEEAMHAGSGFDMGGLTAGDIAPSSEMIANEFSPAVAIPLGQPRDFRSTYDSYWGWRLTPRTIPAMEANRSSLGQFLFSNNDDGIHSTNDTNGAICSDMALSRKDGTYFDLPVIIQPHSTYRFLVDHTILTKGYPIITVSDGGNSEIHLTYLEGLREDIRKNSTQGVMDTFRPDGRKNLAFEPLLYRCWRYLFCEIITREEPLELHSMTYRSTGYPFDFKAEIQGGPWMDRLVSPGLLTLKMCAEDTFWDCPYYERLQYVGDTRIQALLSYILSGDDRLARQAIDAFDRSRLPDGMIQSRYPSRCRQIIPTFSLLYISLLYDFMMWRGDAAFLKEYLWGVKCILHAFAKYRRPDGLLADLPGWCFIDWSNCPHWIDGMPPASPDQTSYLINFQYLYALDHAAALFHWCDEIHYAQELTAQAEELRKRLRDIAFDKSKQLFLDNGSTQIHSQHTNILAILTGCHKGLVDGGDLLKRILGDKELATVSCYYSFYLFEAMYHVGRADMIWTELARWHEMLDRGLTTYPEKYGETRSDCHGWSAHPLYHYFASILGIRPEKPGCTEMSITPPQRFRIESTFPNQLTGALMTPHGIMKVSITYKGKIWVIDSELPPECKLASKWAYD